MNKLQVTFAATLAACTVALADTTVQTFEGQSNTDGKWVPTSETAPGWSTAPAVSVGAETSDYPAIVTTTPSSPDNGYGVVDAAHDKALSINGGTATVTMGGTSSSIITSDLLVKVVHCADDTLSVVGLDAAKLAIAVDVNGRFNACTNSTDTTPFFLLSNKQYAEGEWVRVTTLVDYAKRQCRIALDGQLACNGAWLSLPSGYTAPGSMSITSTSCIDDVVVKAEDSNVYDKYAAVNNDGLNAVLGSNPNIVPINYLLANNMETNSSFVVTEAVKQTYDQGVATNATFAIASGSFDSSSSSVTLTFPGDWPADAYVVKYGTTPNDLKENGTVASLSSSAKSGDVNTVVVNTGNMGDGNVLYYKVVR